MIRRYVFYVVLPVVCSNYLPLIHDITFLLLLIAKMIFGLSAKIADVKIVFLNGNLDEEIFMNCPEGLDGDSHKDALKLQK